MTVLALRLSTQHNGVSRLHGNVSRRMWQFLWPQVESDEVPIGSITNGVHTFTWLAPRLETLYRKHLGPAWAEGVDNPATWAGIEDIPDAELWEAHLALKNDMLALREPVWHASVSVSVRVRRRCSRSARYSIPPP